MSEVPAHFPLLALPDPCLLAVLQCCAADDQRSLFSAARTHSRLHQAAVAALRNIGATVRRQQQADNVLLYLDKHASQINSLKLRGPAQLYHLTFCQLPPTLQLHSLELERWNLQLQPGKGCQGVLGAAAATAAATPLKQLWLQYCTLLDGMEALAAALLQLPALEHLSLCITTVGRSCENRNRFPTGVLQQLQQLTYLELAAIWLRSSDEASAALQPLQALTRLVELRLVDLYPLQQDVTASMVSGMCHLTCLVLMCAAFEPAALAGKAKLLHLELSDCDLQQPSGAAGVAELLSQLQHQTQLTHLTLEASMRAVDERSPLAAAYAALTASSKLQFLNIHGCILPAGAWQHMFPAGRQLLQLTSLDISEVSQLPDRAVLALEGSHIASCWPNLQALDIVALHYSIQHLTQLRELSGLHTLRLTMGTRPRVANSALAGTGEVLQAVCQLTGLRKLALYFPDAPTQLLITQLLQLRQLPYLTTLEYLHPDVGPEPVVLEHKAPGDEPVWRQLLRDHLYNPDVAKATAAALAQ